MGALLKSWVTEKEKVVVLFIFDDVEFTLLKEQVFANPWKGGVPSCDIIPWHLF